MQLLTPSGGARRACAGLRRSDDAVMSAANKLIIII
jgi:hypothetical protein